MVLTTLDFHRWLWREIRRKRRAFARRAAVRSYLVSHRVRKLQVGAGHNHLPDWLNTDRAPDSGAIYLDATKPFPSSDETFDYVFSEHLIEHLSFEEGLAMLRESHRVLKPGGRIRIATPDLETIIGLKNATPGSVEEHYVKWIVDNFVPHAERDLACYAINQLFRGWGHKFLYDRATLGAVLEKVGFTDVCPYAFGDSADEELSGVEGHGTENGNRLMSEFETMILEARTIKQT